MADGDDILAEAIAGTELEIFSEAVGKDLPSTEGGPGDRSVEEMGEGLEGQLEAEEPDLADAKGEGEDDGKGADDDADKGDGKAGQAKDPKTGQFVKADADSKVEQVEKTEKTEVVDETKPKPTRVPLSELQTERKARQALQTELDELKKAPKPVAPDEVERLVNARVAQLLGQQLPPKQEPAADAPKKKDIFEDPEGFVADLRADIERGLTQRYVAADLARTHGEHGKRFEEAYAALDTLDKSNPADRVTVQRIWNSPTPGAELMKWHNQREALSVVGDDLAAFTAKIEAETREKLANDPTFRKQLLETLQTEAKAGEGGSPRHVARMPRSLNGAAGGQGGGIGGNGALDNSERGVFDDAMSGS